jgi:hypothetical protein
LYQVTELRRHLREVQQLGPRGESLAAHLTMLTDAYDMDAVLRLVGQVTREG